jgi:hypothetical protein
MKTNYFKCYWIILFILIPVFSSITIAEDFSLVSLEYEKYPKAPMKADNDKELDITNINLQMNLPLRMDDWNAIFVASPFYQWYQLKGAKNTYLDFQKLQTIGVALLYIQNFGSRSKTITGLIPKIAGDFNIPLSHKDFTFNLAESYNYQITNNLNAGLGIYYIHSFNHPIYSPLINLNWKINHDLTLNMSYPDYLYFDYKISKKVKVGINARFFAAQYNINSLGDSEIKDYKFRYYSGSIGPSASLEFMDNTYLNLSVGYNLMNSYDVIISGRIAEQDLTPNPYFRLGVNYSVSY